MRSGARILACALLALVFGATSGANAEPQEKKPAASAYASDAPTTAAAPSNADGVKAPDHGDTNIWLIVLSSSVISGVLGALISGWINLVMKRRDYADAYYKIVLDRRLEAQDEVEHLITRLKLAVHDDDGRLYHFLFKNDDDLERLPSMDARWRSAKRTKTMTWNWY